VTIAGSRAAWTTAYGGETRILAASIIKCEEWVSARPTVGRQRVAGLSGDGGVLAYAVGDVATGRAQSEIGMVPRRWRGYQLQQVRDRVLGLSVDEGRIATVYDDGLAMVVTRAGRLIARFSVGDARAFSFRRNTLAVLERDALKLYDVRSGRVVRSWRVAERATSVDLQFGLALIAAGRDVLALNVKTGRTAVLFHAPAPVSVQLEAPGAAIQFNAHGHGYLRFAPMSAIEAGTHAQ
jgi:hypothetical protein